MTEGPKSVHIPNLFGPYVNFGNFLAGNFLGGNFLTGNFLSHVVIFGNFMAGNFWGGNFLGGYPPSHNVDSATYFLTIYAIGSRRPRVVGCRFKVIFGNTMNQR